ncbi:MAG: hypothetical protein ACFFD4_35560 [Candidatus Odinarchaeota archaeon]
MARKRNRERYHGYDCKNHWTGDEMKRKRGIAVTCSPIPAILKVFFSSLDGG